MRPLFTIHAGEYVVGDFIERKFRTLNVWIPSKDTGIDLLITNQKNSSSVSLQVKLSKDYSKPEALTEFDQNLIAGGWFTLAHDKIEKSTADHWVFVLVSHERRMSPKFLVIPRAELLRRLENNHGESKSYHFYPWIMKSGIALDGRGLRNKSKMAISDGTLLLGERDLTKFLNNWEALKVLM